MKKSTNQNQTNAFTLAHIGRWTEPQIEMPSKPSVEAFKPARGWKVEDALKQTGLLPVISTEEIHSKWQVLAHDGCGKLYFLSQQNCQEIDARQSTRLFRFITESPYSCDWDDEGLSVWLTILSKAIAGGKKKARVGSVEAEQVEESGLSPDLFVADMIERGLTESQFNNF